MTTIDDPPDIQDKPEEQRVSDQEAANKAFRNSGLHEFNGIPLEGYSIEKRAAAQAMGLHYGSIDEYGKERFLSSKIYPGALRDTAIVLWLCSLTDEREIDGASRMPIAAARKALKWLEAQGIRDTADEKFWEAFVVFLEINGEVSASRVKPEKKITSDSQTTPQATI